MIEVRAMRTHLNHEEWRPARIAGANMSAVGGVCVQVAMDESCSSTQSEGLRSSNMSFELRECFRD